MDQHNGSTGQSPADIFAEASGRIQAGEELETVVTSYPAAYHRNLRDLLAIVGVATEINATNVPSLSSARSSARRQLFLQAAAQHRAVLTASAPASFARSFDDARAWQARLKLLWTAFLASLDFGAMRPAAAALSTVVLLLVSSSLVAYAEASIPGDLAYSAKQWINDQQYYLAPADQRPEIRKEQEQQLAEDVAKAQKKADLKDIVIPEEDILLFHGYGPGYLNIGNLRVIVQYQPDPNQPYGAVMPIIGDLTPGAIVKLRYQILPGQQAAVGEKVVQGISLEVMPQPSEPTPIPTDIVVPTPAAPLGMPPKCTPRQPAGWVVYIVRINDTAWGIAQRSGADVNELRSANCLQGDFVSAQRAIWAPPLAATTDVGTPVLEPTVPVAPTPAATAAISITVTPVVPTIAPTTAPISTTATSVPPLTTPTIAATTGVLTPTTSAPLSSTIVSTLAPSTTVTIAATPPLTPTSPSETPQPAAGETVTTTVVTPVQTAEPIEGAPTEGAPTEGAPTEGPLIEGGLIVSATVQSKTATTATPPAATTTETPLPADGTPAPITTKTAAAEATATAETPVNATPVATPVATDEAATPVVGATPDAATPTLAVPTPAATTGDGATPAGASPTTAAVESAPTEQPAVDNEPPATSDEPAEPANPSPDNADSAGANAGSDSTSGATSSSETTATQPDSATHNEPAVAPPTPDTTSSQSSPAVVDSSPPVEPPAPPPTFPPPAQQPAESTPAE